MSHVNATKLGVGRIDPIYAENLSPPTKALLLLFGRYGLRLRQQRFKLAALFSGWLTCTTSLDIRVLILKSSWLEMLVGIVRAVLAVALAREEVCFVALIELPLDC